MTLNVLCWNSQGHRSDYLWRNLIQMGDPQSRTHPIPGPSLLPGLYPASRQFPHNSQTSDDLLVFVCEAGIPPWMTDVDVFWGQLYKFQYGDASPAVPGLRLRAVASSRRVSADAAAAAYGVDWFDDPRALIDHPAWTSWWSRSGCPGTTHSSERHWLRAKWSTATGRSAWTSPRRES